MRIVVLVFTMLAATASAIPAEAQDSTMETRHRPFGYYVQECVETLMKYGTDRYGEKEAPILVSILDVETRSCPENPEPFDEYFRVTRRGRRSPAGANMLPDQPLLKTMYLLSDSTGKKRYARFADKYERYYMQNLVDDKGFFWWGWHRHYDVHRDVEDGHNGNHHETHAVHAIDWDHLYAVNPEAVEKEIEAIWEWHVIDKDTCEINRHGDKQKGCDFSMSAGSYIEAFAFMYDKTGEEKWLDRATRLADYYWQRRNPETNLFPERPNAGADRFDGSTFVTAITGLHCHSLLRAYELTGEPLFRDHAIAYLKAYAKYGYDADTGKWWGALRMDGSPILGPRIYTANIDSREGYEAAQPRGHLDLWEPYVAGYQYPIYTAQAYAYAYQITGDKDLLEAAKRLAAWISKTPPGTPETDVTWYQDYSNGPGKQGTYAGKYGRAISFLAHMYVLTGEDQYLTDAHTLAYEAVDKLYHNGLFRGHPAKPYYENIDGVGFLLYALLELDQLNDDPEAAVAEKKIVVGKKKVAMALDNW